MKLLCPYICAHNLDVFEWMVIVVGGDSSHAMDHGHARLHSTKDCVLAVQPLGRAERNEELATICVRTGIGHRQHSSSCVLQVGVYLVVERLAINGRTASACSRGVAALNHEIRYDSVKLDVVVVAAAGKFGEVSARVRGVLPVQLYGYVAHATIQDNTIPHSAANSRRHAATSRAKQLGCDEETAG